MSAHETARAPKWTLSHNGNVLRGERLAIVTTGAGLEREDLLALVADANVGAQANASAAPEPPVDDQATVDLAGRLADAHDKIAGAIKQLSGVYDGPETPNGSAIATARGILEGDLEPDGKPWYLPRDAVAAAPVSPAVESQAGAEIGDEELREIAELARLWSSNTYTEGQDDEMRLVDLDQHLTSHQLAFACGVITGRKRNRAALQVARGEADYLRRQLHELQAEAWPLSRQLHDKADAPAASPAGGGAASELVRELADRLLHHHKLSCEARKPPASNFQKNKRRCTCGLDELLARAAAFVDPAPALADALRRWLPGGAENMTNMTKDRLEQFDEDTALLAAYAAASTAKPATDSLSGEGGGQ